MDSNNNNLKAIITTSYSNRLSLETVKNFKIIELLWLVEI